ncbi:MAG: alpha/beta hydrolase [Solirubrobacterales bacterium]|jgi:pimeloyl-ACP methyl ester carboxylesterase|nr:alpha/beta hydrolase [Solirubrobacterales bacterium]
MATVPAVQTTTRGEVELAYLERGEGPLVVCLHGFPDAMWGWIPVLDALAAAGFHAVAPALRGYAPSALPPRSRTTPLDLGRDVVALADHLGAERFDVVGHDWGAVAAYAAGNLAPHRVRRIVTAAVPHTAHFLKPRPRQLVRSRYMLQFQPPVLPERFVTKDDWAWLDALVRRWSPTWDVTDEELLELRRGMVGPGRLSAALGYYRGLAKLAVPEVRRVSLGRVAAPALVVHGSDDGCIGPEVFAGQEAWFTGGLRVETMAGLGHFVQREDPAAFAALALSHLAD